MKRWAKREPPAMIQEGKDTKISIFFFHKGYAMKLISRKVIKELSSFLKNKRTIT